MDHVGSNRFLRRYAEHRFELNKQIEAFAVKDASCFSDGDRKLIMSVIEHIYCRSSVTDQGAAIFECTVQTNVKTHVQRHLGPVAEPPPQLSILVITFMLLSLLDLLAIHLSIPTENPSYTVKAEDTFQILLYCFAVVGGSYLFIHTQFALASTLQHYHGRMPGFILDIMTVIGVAAVSYPTTVLIPGLILRLPTHLSTTGNFFWGIFNFSVPYCCRFCVKRCARSRATVYPEDIQGSADDERHKHVPSPSADQAAEGIASVVCSPKADLPF